MRKPLFTLVLSLCTLLGDLVIWCIATGLLCLLCVRRQMGIPVISRGILTIRLNPILGSFLNKLNNHFSF